MHRGRAAVPVVALALVACASPARLPAERLDAALADRVFLRLAERPGLAGDIDVAAERDLVSLTGTVPSDEARRQAVAVARETPGVTEVRDTLEVAPAPPAPALADAGLARAAAAAIAAALPHSRPEGVARGRVEAEDDSWLVVVAASRGALALRGRVPGPAFVRPAVEAARRVPGVVSVRSELRLDRLAVGAPPPAAAGAGYWGPRPGELYHSRDRIGVFGGPAGGR